MSEFRRKLMMAAGENEIPNYLRFTALEDGTFTISFNTTVSTSWMQYVEYSTDEGITWTKVQNVNNQTITHTTPTILEGESILWRGEGTKTGRASYYTTFTSTCRFNASGNIYSLLNLDSFENVTSVGEDGYRGIFYNCNKLISAYDLELPAITIGKNSYSQMFKGCTGLTHAPMEISATSFNSTDCCTEMFMNCSALIVAPVLPAKTMTANCYKSMFSDCVNLEDAPELPATTLASNCYNLMFNGCKKIVTSPELPAETLATSCYFQMFKGCTALTSAPELPSTTLANNCYMNMFQSCTSLLTAPELPTLTLKTQCYQAIFYDAKKVNYIKMLATDISASNCLNVWLNGVNNVSTSIFVKHIDATWTTTGTSGVLSNWKVIYYDPTLNKYYTDQTRATECDDHGNPI